MHFLRCFLYLFAVGVLSFVLGRGLATRAIDPEKGWFRSYKWERDGKIYEYLGIRSWYKKLPDMSRILPRTMPKKTLEHDYVYHLPTVIRETCVAEIVHVFLSVAGFGCLLIWPGVGGVTVTVLFSVILNGPFILVQRYNRPRLIRLYKRLLKKRAEMPPLVKTTTQTGASR